MGDGVNVKQFRDGGIGLRMCFPLFLEMCGQKISL